MDKVAVIGYMYELDKELRKRLSDYPFYQIILNEAMNEALLLANQCHDSSFSDKEAAIGFIDLSIKSIFRRQNFPSEDKYWDSQKKYIGKKEYNKENLGYEEFVSYTSIDNQNSRYFIGGAKFCMEHYDSSFLYKEKNNNKHGKTLYILKFITIIISLLIAYLFALNGRYYVSDKGIILDKWEQRIKNYKEFR